MKVLIPQVLHSYTGFRSQVEAAGGTVDEVMRDLDRQFPGLRFRVIDEQDRIRPHVKLFLNRVQVMSLAVPVGPADEVALVQAFSGG